MICISNIFVNENAIWRSKNNEPNIIVNIPQIIQFYFFENEFIELSKLI